MKITKEEFQRIGKESPLELFHQGIKAKETRTKQHCIITQVNAHFLGTKGGLCLFTDNQ